MKKDKILYFKDIKENSCGTCERGILGYNKEGEITFAKCLEGYFDFKLDKGYYSGNLPRTKTVLFNKKLPCKGKKYLSSV